MTKRKIYALLIILTVVLMLAAVVVMMVATDFKDLEEFNDTELTWFFVFLGGEAVLFIAMLVFASLIGGHEVEGDEEPPTHYERIIRTRGIILLITSALLAILLTVSGELLSPMLTGLYPVFIPLLIIGAVELPVLLLVNHILTKSFSKSLEQRGAREVQRYVYEHREDATESAERKLCDMARARAASDAIAVCVSIFACISAFSAGVLNIGISVIFTLVGAMGIAAGLSRVRVKIPPEVTFEDDDSFVSREDYPELFGLIEEVRDSLGIKGEIKLTFSYDANAAIMRVGDYIAISIGGILLECQSREELRAILYHELGHLYTRELRHEREVEYKSFIEMGGIPHLFGGLTNGIYSFPDSMYILSFLLYSYSSSIMIEERADSFMKEYTDPAVAASALLRISYYDIFEWEDLPRDYEPFYAGEEISESILTWQIRNFHEACEERREAWNELIRVEILARNASHPTLRMRLDALGVTDYRLISEGNTEEYLEERTRVVKMLDEKLLEIEKEDYEKEREARYVAPLADVKRWEENGRPVDPLEYRDIIEALSIVGRVVDAEALADRAIAELSSSAACFAHFHKGAAMLHRFDEGGIEHLYHAIENNHNYIEEGLEIIGRYCCLAGKEDELERYRARAIEMSETSLRDNDEIGRIDRSDNLVSEQLTGEMLNELKAFIASVDEGRIDEVYLVRKVIRDDFFTSCVIVRTVRDIDEDARHDVMHRIFTYLDTSSDWQFSLFDYHSAPMFKIKKIKDSLIYSGNK